VRNQLFYNVSKCMPKNYTTGQLLNNVGWFRLWGLEACYSTGTEIFLATNKASSALSHFRSPQEKFRGFLYGSFLLVIAV
jgi:hypothetical protein